MPERFIATSNDIYIAIFAMVAALWGGLVSYFNSVESGLKHSMTSLAIHVATSGFAGFMGYLMCLSAETPAPITGIVCGIAGHMGTEAIRLFEKRFTDRLK